MKILFNDILSQCVVSATATDTNFPVANLAHPFLRRRWQSLNTSDTITIESPTALSINSVYLSYTNATTIQLRFYGFDIIGYGGYAIGYTTYAIALESPSAGSWMPIPDNVLHMSNTAFSKIEIELSSSDGAPVYLGKVAIGIDYNIDPPESFWTESFEDKSIISKSDAGQVLQEYIEPLRTYSWRFPTMDRTETRALEAQYVATGNGKPIFVDPLTDELPIIYCHISNPLSVQKTKRQYTTTINFVEAR